MHSRARLLIERDYKRLKDNKPLGIDAHPVTEGNYFEWTATIEGLKDTDWEGGIFQLYIKFDENYNNIPPQVFFQSIPFHPNVNTATGQPYIHFLTDFNQWDKESYDLMYILVSIQAMLSYPLLDAAVNTDAAEILQNHPLQYQQMVHQCVTASQLLRDVQLNHVDVVKESVCVPVTSSPRAIHKRQRIPFEDYYQTWTNIATSKTQNSLIDHGLLDDSQQLGLTSLVSSHAPSKIYENQKPLTREKSGVKRKIEKINQMRQLYTRQQITASCPLHSPRSDCTTDRQTDIKVRNGETDHWEKEADELVLWTKHLDI